jgi:hypothetical protein
MEIHHLRSWAELTDKATVIALAVAAIALIAAGATSWLSFKYNRGLRSQESTALDRATDHTAMMEKEIVALREHSSQLEKALVEVIEGAAEARKQIVRIEEAVEAAKVRAADLEKEVAAAKANNVKSRDEVEPPKSPGEEVDGKHLQLVGSLQKFAGTKVAIYAVGEVPEAAEGGSSINRLLTEAGWASSMWKWTGVSGIVGVVVLTKEGIDPTMDQVAIATVGILRSAGYNAVKASWPTDADWRRFQGTLSGPQSPDPTEARIRVVIGARPHDSTGNRSSL